MLIVLALAHHSLFPDLLAGFPVHPERSGSLVIKPTGADLPAKLCKEDTIPSGAPCSLLEAL